MERGRLGKMVSRHSTLEKRHSEMINRQLLRQCHDWRERRGQAARQETRPSSSRARKFCPERFVSLVTWRHAGHVTVSSLQRIDPLCGSITQPISKHPPLLIPRLGKNSGLKIDLERKESGRAKARWKVASLKVYRACAHGRKEDLSSINGVWQSNLPVIIHARIK